MTLRLTEAQHAHGGDSFALRLQPQHHHSNTNLSLSFVLGVMTLVQVRPLCENLLQPVGFLRPCGGNSPFVSSDKRVDPFRGCGANRRWSELGRPKPQRPPLTGIHLPQSGERVCSNKHTAAQSKQLVLCKHGGKWSTFSRMFLHVLNPRGERG
ncbi:hypothetical protein CRENBAI_012880 [Crenichthys baileyi]|uniref:Uncharacterized protein n=1 Tax=Crenichthys baileyi TaxID=28760 RepID=A0AAV9R928_9TELE